MKMDIPFYSQHAVDVPIEWRDRACGIIALRMVIESKTGNILDPKVLIETGVMNGAYSPGIGWKHDGLVALAMKYGLPSYRKEFTDTTQGIEFIKLALDKGEIVISSIRIDGKKGTHLIVLVGFDEKGFYYHDSAKLDKSSGTNLFIREEEFARLWRKLAIFVG
jgi:uncharacterized protein YvpB